MKIGIIVGALWIGGTERQAILCVSELRKLGHSVDLIHYYPKVQYLEMLAHLQVTPIYVPASGFLQKCRRLRALFLEREYDVVHGFSMASEVYAAVAGSWARVPYRFGSFRSMYSLGLHYRLFHYVVDKFLDGWVVNSKPSAESMARKARISPNKIRVLPNGVLCEMFSSPMNSREAKARLGLPGDALVVTMLARLERPKNHRMLIDVAVCVLEQAPQARFLLVGGGAMEKALHEYTLERGVSDKVAFLGKRSDVAEILAATDVSVLTSDIEGMPNAIIEAMAAGKPIACTDYPGFEQVLTHESNALISPRGDVNAFAQNLLLLIATPLLRERLGNTARKDAQERFSTERMAKNLEQIYLTLGGAALKPTASPPSKCISRGGAL